MRLDRGAVSFVPMADIQALKILKSNIDAFTKLPDPPTTDSEIEFKKYKTTIEQVMLFYKAIFRLNLNELFIICVFVFPPPPNISFYSN